MRQYGAQASPKCVTWTSALRGLTWMAAASSPTRFHFSAISATFDW